MLFVSLGCGWFGRCNWLSDHPADRCRLLYMPWPRRSNHPTTKSHQRTACRWHLIKRGCLLGALVSGGLSVATLLSKTSVLKGLTSDAAVQAACLSVFPMVMACQVNKGACAACVPPECGWPCVS